MDVDALKQRLGLDRDADLAKELGVPTSLVSDVRRRHRKPSLQMASKASEVTKDPSYFQEYMARRVGA